MRLGVRVMVLMSLSAMGLWFATGRTAEAQQTRQATPAVTEEKLDPRSQAIWSRYWQKTASNYIKFDGEFLCIRGYNNRYPSSRGVTVNDLLTRDKGYLIRLRTARGTTMERRVNLSPAEAQAIAMALPEMKVGNYGYLHSVEIDQVLSPTQMIVRSTWLVDAQTLYRSRDDDRDRLVTQYGYTAASQLVEALYKNRMSLVDMQQQSGFNRRVLLDGFSTDRLTSGMRWRGPGNGGLQIAILTVRDLQEDGGEGRGRRRILVATPVGRLRSGLDRQEFDELLASRKITRKDLIAVIDEARRDVVHDVEKSMVDAIETNAPASKSADPADTDE